MARSINQKCWECSMLTCEQARQLHGSDGDGCWDEKICHRRRSHYRNRADNNQKRKGQYAVVKAQAEADRPENPQLGEVLTAKLQVPPVALLYLYKEARKDAHLHAIAITVWQGDTKLESISATHCLGMTNSQIRKYLQEVLQELNQRYGIRTFEPEIRYDPAFCPVQPCPLKTL